MSAMGLFGCSDVFFFLPLLALPVVPLLVVLVAVVLVFVFLGVVTGCVVSSGLPAVLSTASVELCE